MLRLIRPTITLKESFLEALSEYHKEKRYLHLSIPQLNESFEAYLAEVLAQEHLAKQQLVPATVFWLVEGDEFIGRTSVRHYLDGWLLRVGGHIGYDIRPSKRRLGYGTKILALALSEATRLGIEHALITCDEDNEGSRRIIEKNGGVLENILTIEGLPKRKRRYWIALP